jgi:hypothetical protein
MRSNVARIVPRRASTNTEQTTIRLPKDELSRAEALRPKLAVAGLEVSLTDVLRVAVQRGLDSLETEVHERDKATRKR